MWIDLLADDPEEAKRFYGGLFGWTFETIEDDGYATIRMGDRAVGGLLRHRPDHDTEPDDLWLSSLSMAEVDAAAERAASAGGSVVRAPQTVGERGRVAVLRDPEGALFAVLQPSGGAPARARPTAGEVAWVQLWARDHEVSARFYERLAGWKTGRTLVHGEIDEAFFEVSGREVASVIELPWKDVQPNWLPYVAVASVPATMARASELGGRTLVRGEQAAVLQDSQGAAIGIVPLGEAARRDR